LDYMLRWAAKRVKLPRHLERATESVVDG
jgi:hypothetical protein